MVVFDLPQLCLSYFQCLGNVLLAWPVIIMAGATFNAWVMKMFLTLGAVKMLVPFCSPSCLWFCFLSEQVVERAQQKLKLDAMIVQQGRLTDNAKKVRGG